MFEKESEERVKHLRLSRPNVYVPVSRVEYWKDGAEFGYNKANEWNKVSDKLPEMDVLVYLWNNIDDFPVVARRHIFYGQENWVWDCKWGSGYTVTQSAGKNYLWKEIVLPELKESK